MKTKNILVLGAGVSGLSTGILLLKAGYSVTIWAKDLPPNTTSDKAAAVWYPYLCFPKEKAIPWAKNTFDYIQKELLPHPESGCIIKTAIELLDERQPIPWWKDTIPWPIKQATKDELPEGYEHGFKFDTIIIDTTMYMKYLVNMFQELGGILIQKTITDIQEALKENPTVINCTGLGSKELMKDDRMFPVRGQMVKVKKNGFDKVVFDADGHNSLALATVRVNDIMLGGTSQKNNDNEEIDPKDTAEILRKAAILDPSLKEVEIIEEIVGLRPARDAIRVELEEFSDGNVIHNYGHGGAGFTLSWGCALDVVALVEAL